MMPSNEYSVGRAYRFAAGLFLVLSPYFYYRFFADIVYGEDGKHWESIVISFRHHPAIIIGLLGLPALVVFIVLLLLTYRFAVDLLFVRTVSGVLEAAEIVKTRFLGERISVEISGKRLAVLNDQDVASLLLARESIGRNAMLKFGGFNKALYLRLS